METFQNYTERQKNARSVRDDRARDPSRKSIKKVKATGGRARTRPDVDLVRDQAERAKAKPTELARPQLRLLLPIAATVICNGLTTR